jgi:hypothetical protein
LHLWLCKCVAARSTSDTSGSLWNTTNPYGRTYVAGLLREYGLPALAAFRRLVDLTELPAITHHRFLVSTLDIPPKSSSPDMGLANANAEWFRYSLIQNLSKHLLVARNNLQTLPPEFERTFLTHQLAVLRMIKNEIATGVFTYTALGVMSALALCKVSRTPNRADRLTSLVPNR